MKRALLILLLSFIFISPEYAQEKRFLTVAKDGTGDYSTITSALNSLPQFLYQRTVIFVKEGVYNEKIRIEKDYVTIKGESKEKTIIEYSQLRSDWDAHKDSIGPGVINIYADDIVLENLTIKNTQPQIGPHAFAIYGFGTRTILLNCSVLSKGADTVSLWNNKNGMYYHSGCYFEGAVDFVCPRGWCFIKDSQFYEVRNSASIWHAGGDDKDQKFVLKNCTFAGADGWELGRHHYEAQFYLIDCKFAANLSPKPIYRVTYPNEPQRDRPFNWGPRYYFYNCVKEGEPFDWLKNSLIKSGASPKQVTAKWTYTGKWDPEKTEGARVTNYKIEKNTLLLFLSEKVTVEGKPLLISSNGKKFTYHSGAGSDTLRFDSDIALTAGDIRNLKILNNSKIYSSEAAIIERNTNLNLK